VTGAIVIGADPFACGALAFAGVTPIGVVDPDAPAAAARLGLLHPGVLFEPYPVALAEAHPAAIVGGAGLVVDVSGDEAARLAANDACRVAGVPFTTAAVGEKGALVLSAPGHADGCWRCAGVSAPAGQMPAPLGPLAAALAVAAGLAGTAGVLEVDAATLAVARRAVPPLPDCAACAAQSS